MHFVDPIPISDLLMEDLLLMGGRPQSGGLLNCLRVGKWI